MRELTRDDDPVRRLPQLPRRHLDRAGARRPVRLRRVDQRRPPAPPEVPRPAHRQGRVGRRPRGVKSNECQLSRAMPRSEFEACRRVSRRVLLRFRRERGQSEERRPSGERCDECIEKVVASNASRTLRTPREIEPWQLGLESVHDHATGRRAFVRPGLLVALSRAAPALDGCGRIDLEDLALDPNAIERSLALAGHAAQDRSAPPCADRAVIGGTPLEAGGERLGASANRASDPRPRRALPRIRAISRDARSPLRSSPTATCPTRSRRSRCFAAGPRGRCRESSWVQALNAEARSRRASAIRRSGKVGRGTSYEVSALGRLRCLTLPCIGRRGQVLMSTIPRASAAGQLDG